MALSKDTAALAVIRSTDRFPLVQPAFDPNGIEIDLRHLRGEEDGSPEYYLAASKKIDAGVRERLYEGIRTNQVDQLSVFAIARLPLLVYLGWALLGEGVTCRTTAPDRVFPLGSHAPGPSSVGAASPAVRGLVACGCGGSSSLSAQDGLGDAVAHKRREQFDLEQRAMHRRAVEAVIWGMPAVNYRRMYEASCRGQTHGSSRCQRGPRAVRSMKA
jgi:hypothetical protein